MRRYTDTEVTEIFRRAAAEPPPSPHAAEGFTLAELQAIGGEVGIAPESVAAAARSLERTEPAATDTLLGLPIAVRHAVTLDRQLGDAEWDALVVAARETFSAEGRLQAQGSFRQWRNGNLKVLLEPGAEGSRLRFQTLNGHARRMIFGGSAALATAAVLLGVTAFTGVAGVPYDLSPVIWLGLLGAAMLTRGVWGLRRWAARRQAQFRELAARAAGE